MSEKTTGDSLPLGVRRVYAAINTAISDEATKLYAEAIASGIDYPAAKVAADLHTAVIAAHAVASQQLGTDPLGELEVFAAILEAGMDSPNEVRGMHLNLPDGMLLAREQEFDAQEAAEKLTATE